MHQYIGSSKEVEVKALLADDPLRLSGTSATLANIYILARFRGTGFPA